MIRSSILPLFALYPPQTTRIILQLAYLKHCLESGISVAEYLETRSHKYDNRELITPLIFDPPEYFGNWLSGFIEAEGSFAKRANKAGFSFSIGQIADRYLLQAILSFFDQSHLAIHSKAKGFYFIEIANIRGLTAVIEHLLVQPLQGQKYYQLAFKMQDSVALYPFRAHFWKSSTYA